MEPSYSVRPATSADQAFISEMQYEALFVPPGEPAFERSVLDEPAIARYHVGFGTMAGDVGVIAEAPDGRPIGAAWVRLVDGFGFVDHETPELAIAVVDEARGAGVGSALLRELLQRVSRVSASVDERNPVIRLYRRFGFELERTEGDHTSVLVRDGRA